MKKSPTTLAILLTSTIILASPWAMASKPLPTMATSITTVDPLVNADADMKAVLDAQKSLGGKPVEILTPAQARIQPTPADGVKLVMQKSGMNINDSMGITVKNLTYKTVDGTALPARVYFPADADSNKPLPVVVYYHGGGWVLADIDVYDSSPRAIAKMAKAIVVSIEYRKAPEHKFPAAHEDAFAAYKWVLGNAAQWGGDISRIAVLGESAGGSLAINTAIMARDAKIQQPLAEVLVYPVAGVDMNTKSYQENANAKPLNKAMMGWFLKYTTNSSADKMDPRLDLIGKANLSGLPPTTIITAQIDPLRNDGEMLAAKLEKANVLVEIRNYEGVTHEFFGMGAVVDKAKTAEEFAADRLKSAFNN